MQKEWMLSRRTDDSCVRSTVKFSHPPRDGRTTHIRYNTVQHSIVRIVQTPHATCTMQCAMCNVRMQTHPPSCHNAVTGREEDPDIYQSINPTLRLDTSHQYDFRSVYHANIARSSWDLRGHLWCQSACRRLIKGEAFILFSTMGAWRTRPLFSSEGERGKCKRTLHVPQTALLIRKDQQAMQISVRDDLRQWE